MLSYNFYSAYNEINEKIYDALKPYPKLIEKRNYHIYKYIERPRYIAKYAHSPIRKVTIEFAGQLNTTNYDNPNEWDILWDKHSTDRDIRPIMDRAQRLKADGLIDNRQLNLIEFARKMS